MLKQKLAKLIEQAVIEAQQRERIPPVVFPEIVIEHPQNVAYGDYASSLPLRLARAMGLNPLEIARIVIELMTPTSEVEEVKAEPPGFINFTLSNNWLTQQVESILSSGEDYGNINAGTGTKVQLEFVSVNPTGPLHIGHGRGAVLGSTLANALSAAGYSVETEYYVNDAGTQMEAFYRSLYARYQEALGKPAELPSDGYYGTYVVDLAKEIITERGQEFADLPPKEAIQQLGRIGREKVLQTIKSALELLGVKFDVWFSEQSLYREGQYQKVMSLLQQKGFVTEKEGAIWFTSSNLGEDKDNVLVRSNGTPTYFASDCAYHYNKFLERNFDKVINIWGADHQGHIPRMKAVMSALDIAPERLQVIITQMVTLRRGGMEVRLSKRSGDVISLQEVIDEVGSDACRFFFLSRAASSQMEFDIELAKRQSMDNPVYYIQYAHARIASILRLAEEKKIDCSQGNVSLLTTEPELTLIRQMIHLPEMVELVAHSLEPHHLPHYAQELATAFHSFYKQCRVISEDEDLTKARLKLVIAAGIVLAKTLHIMGMSAPERM